MTTSSYLSDWVCKDEVGNSIQKIEKFLPHCGDLRRILDIGCGAGAVSGELVKRNVEVYGLDSQPVAVELAKKKGIRAVVHDLNEPLPFQKHFFDLVLVLDVLDFVQAPHALLEEIRRVLKPSGNAIVVLPNAFDLRQRLKIISGHGIVSYKMAVYDTPVDPWAYLHIKFFTHMEMRRLFAAAKFSVEREDFIPIWKGGLGIVAKTIYRILCRPYFVRRFPGTFSSSISFLLKPQGTG